MPGPLEEYARCFDDMSSQCALRRGFRESLLGLLLPRERNKTLTALVGTEPGVGAQAAAVQRLQSFVTESPWEATAINRRRLELLQADPRTPTHSGELFAISVEKRWAAIRSQVRNGFQGNSSNNAFASCKSLVSNPSVNQP